MRNAKIINSKIEQGDTSLLFEGQYIKEIFAHEDSLISLYDEVLELNGETIIAGFIDIHNHGAVGVDVNSAGVEDLRKVSRFLASKGVCAWLPTLVPDRG
ncbi:MAG: hypothetical protein WKF71_10405 [Pyrinomonadaceae bacterium]